MAKLSLSGNIRSNEDDSHGMHDVVIETPESCSIGVQVTALTSELRRKREAMRATYLKKVIDLLVVDNVFSEEKLMVKLYFNSADPEELKFEKPERIVKAIKSKLSTCSQNYIERGTYKISFKKIGTSIFLSQMSTILGLTLILINFQALRRFIEKRLNILSARRPIQYLLGF